MFVINAIAPMVINARLWPLLTRGREVLLPVSSVFDFYFILANRYNRYTHFGKSLQNPTVSLTTPPSLYDALRVLESEARSNLNATSDPQLAMPVPATESCPAEPVSPFPCPRRKSPSKSRRSPASQVHGGVSMPLPAEVCRFIVNVSAMEGRFYREYKTQFHPHTNAAKAALNSEQG